MSTNIDMHTQWNRLLWDRLAIAHTENSTSYYDIDGFLAGKSSLSQIVKDEMAAAVGTVYGLDLLHLQCHFGIDSLTWARRGARVTGLDFSALAVDRAHELMARAGLEAEFVQADAMRLPADLDGRFDVVFASYGVLCWISDIDAWFAGAHRALREGGKLVLVDLHPLLLALDSTTPLVFGTPVQGGAAHLDQWIGTYADADVPIAQPSVSYPHGLGEIVTAAATAGFTIQHLTEHLSDQEPRPGITTQDADGNYTLTVGGAALPVTYSLRAHKS
ncbi:class I SAM-dependent methyltransferase [Kribbella sp. NPDC055071]